MAKDKEQLEFASFNEFDPDELKDSVRETLLLMEPPERTLFIETLAYEMFHFGLSISAYLIPLGIPAKGAEDLTPNEVGHLIRFFSINVPKAMPAVVRLLRRCPVLATLPQRGCATGA
ncbi:MAG TPA: hypothetical protein VFB82_02095 [Blastocatellia bacterium]|jgi:hypothetical protein|nr:hypothetical protein [Blastocatellia bacterium]